MGSNQNKFYFSDSAKIFILAFCALSASACSIYQSSGREILEKDTGKIVTTSGFQLDLSAKYECFEAVHTPDIWNGVSTPLDEYSQSDMIDARLTQTEELPVVLISLRHETEAHFQGCTLQILDSKLSSQRLQDVVAFGEKILLEATQTDK